MARKKRSKPSFEPSPDAADETEAAWIHRSDAERSEPAAPIAGVPIAAVPVVAASVATVAVPLAPAVTPPPAPILDTWRPRAAAAGPAMTTAPSGLFDGVMKLIATPVILGLAAVSIPASWWRRSPERSRR